MNTGDLYWVEFPARAGRAQAGRRPALIAQATAATAKLPTALVIPLTTQLDALRFPGTLLIEPDATNRLRRPSVALVFQLTVIDKRFFGARLGRIGSDRLADVWLAFDTIAGRRPEA